MPRFAGTPEKGPAKIWMQCQKMAPNPARQRKASQESAVQRRDKTPHCRAPDSQEGPSLLSSRAVFGGTNSFNPAQLQFLTISHEPWLREWEDHISHDLLPKYAVSQAILLEVACQRTCLQPSPILRSLSQASWDLKHGAGL